jgi:2-amino-4-hydroxy-6-hydroxymethyldihydropteridine diphosphokinase
MSASAGEALGRDDDAAGAGGDSTPRRRAFLSLGANLGERAAALRAAREALAGLRATDLVGVSPIYETEPQELPDQPPFLNQVVCLESGLGPAELLTACQAIEAAAGRERTVRFGPRTLDVDILLIEGVACDTAALTLPHPRMWRRAFVLVPLATVWPLARGMPPVDVPALAAGLAAGQGVNLYLSAEA